MQPVVNLFAVLNLLGAAQSLLLALALVSVKRGNRTANVLLAIFAATVSAMITWNVLNTTRYILLFPHLLRLTNPLDFVAGPLLYLYIRTLTSKAPAVGKRDLLHFIPFGLCVLYLLPYYFQSSEYKLNIYKSPADLQWYYVRASLAILQALVYFVFIGLLIVRYLRAAKDKKSPAERAVLSQVRLIAISFFALWLIALLRHMFDLHRPAYMRYTNLVLPLCTTIIIYVMAYLGLRKPETLMGTDAPPPATEPDGPPAKKYEKSTLTSERAEVYLNKLLTLMEREKPYLDGDLTLPGLAAKLSVPTHHLSQIINERLNQNFFDFVNAHRVEEAKRELINPAKKHYSLAAIAEEVGFNSKSAFNTAFRKHTNMTPSAFRKVSNGNEQH
jgi:AraC-like DNA-binding protein